MSLARQLLIAGVLTLPLITACGRSNPPAPTPGSNQGETITGRERIGWDQQAASAGELAAFRYAIYVDGARSELAEVTCATTAGATGFACSGRLPTIAAGTHTLELATFFVEGETVLESARSTPMRVTVTGATPGDGAGTPWTSGDAGVTSDGVRLRVERVAEGLVEPVDASAAPDGRMFIAERGGRVVVFADGSLQDASARLGDEVAEGGALLSLALDADFARTRFVYVLYSAPARDGLVYRLARFRELAGRLGERAVLLNDIAPAAEMPSAVVRTGPEGRLLIGVAGAVSWYDGQLPRILLGGLESPGGLAWDAGRSMVWVLDRRPDAGVVNAIDIDPKGLARVRLASRLKDRDAASMVVYDGSLIPQFSGNVLVASEEGRHILRLQADPQSGRLTGEPLLQDLVGGIRVVAVAPDGLIYFCTSDALGVVTSR